MIKARMTPTTFEKVAKALFTRCIASPAILPAQMRTVFQINDPISVSVKNFVKFIFAIPAGTEIRLRTIGINLPKKTAFPPYRLNQYAALAISSRFSRSVEPILPSTTDPSFSTLTNFPKAYRTVAPIIEPMVEATITPGTVIVLSIVRQPPSVRMTSDGIGGNIFSIAISRQIPKYPN